jgi:hypothetical protein
MSMSFLRAAALASALLVAAGPAAPHSVEPPTPAQVKLIENQIEAFRAEIRTAVAAKDVVALRAIYADSFTHTHGSGKMDGKDARIVALLAGDPAIETAPTTELSFRVFGADTVIVTGKSPILNTTENRHYDFRWLAVYVRDRGPWQLAASQATRLPSN